MQRADTSILSLKQSRHWAGWFQSACLAAGLLAGVALAGCRTSAGTEATASEKTAVAAPVGAHSVAGSARSDPGVGDKRSKIVCFGDSLTAGYGTDPGQSYPDDLQQLLDAHGYSYHVVNAGISGETTKDGLERVGSIIREHPAIVVVAFGGNDGLRGLPLEETQSNLASMVAALQKSGAQVVLAGISLPPEYGPEYIGKINAIYPALSKQFHVRLLPFLLQDVYGVPGDMQGDGHHATAKGNVQVARNVEAVLKPLLHR